MTALDKPFLLKKRDKRFEKVKKVKKINGVGPIGWSKAVKEVL